MLSSLLEKVSPVLELDVSPQRRACRWSVATPNWQSSNSALPVPPWTPRTEEERILHDEALERRRQRQDAERRGSGSA